MTPSPSIFFKSVFVTFTMALILASFSTFANAQQSLKPRPPGVKMSLSQMQAMPTTNKVHVKFKEGMRVRLGNGQLSGLASGQSSQFSAAAQAVGVNPQGIRRQFSVSEQKLDEMREAGQRKTGKALADLNLYFVVDVPAGKTAAEVANELNKLDFVEFAEPAPKLVPLPVDIAPTTPNFTGSQGYKNSAPTGIGVNTVTGAIGDRVRYADVEYSWQTNHEDLELAASRTINVGSAPVDPFSNTNHGTAVMGVVSGRENQYGVTGIAPAADGFMSAANTAAGFDPANAITSAAAALSAGDVILIEQQAAVCGLTDFGPQEWIQSVFDAISAATASGIIVVEAAGNGDVDLDAAGCLNRFNRATRDSGAIIVGAGSNFNRSKLSFSSFGSRVDVQGWGQNVRTTGYLNAVPGTTDIRQRYTGGFNGTSSASPIVTGAVLAIQGRAKACGLPVVSPAAMRAALVATGSAQTGGGGLIGPLPNVPAALSNLSLTCLSPTNDNFYSAATLNGGGGTAFGTNRYATSEQGENKPIIFSSRSVWWKWTAPKSGTVMFDTNGSAVNTTLGIYTGNAVAELTKITSNNDGGTGNAALVTFNATSGQTYYINVSGHFGANGNVRLNYGQNYIINALRSPVSGGTVTGGATYKYGKTATLKATPSPIYNFTGWYEGAARVSTLATYAFTVTRDRNLVARFALQNRTITLSRSPTTGGTVFGAGTYAYGTTRTVKATPNSGYSFKNWTEGAVSVSNLASYTFVLKANRSLRANFTLNQRTLTVNGLGDGKGTVTSVPAGISCTSTAGVESGTCSKKYNSGTIVKLTAVAGANSVFKNWTGCDSPSGKVCTQTLGANETVKPTFEAYAANDKIVNSKLIAGPSGSDISEENTKYSMETGERRHGGVGAGDVNGRSAWWKWTAAATGQMQFNSASSVGDTVISAYIAGGKTPTISNITQLASNDNAAGGSDGRIYLHVEKGKTYYLVIAARKVSETAVGKYTLRWGTVAGATTGLLAAVLPGARSVKTGDVGTAFATLFNTSTTNATNCSIAMPGVPFGSSMFQYQTTDAANKLTGIVNTPVNIAAGKFQGFVFGIKPGANITNGADAKLVFDCSNMTPVTTIVGLNTLLLSSATAQPADMVSVADTVGKNGIADIPGNTGTGFFVAAVVNNNGPSRTIVASVDTGGKTLPVAFTLCRSNATGACLQPPSATVSFTAATNTPNTFTIYVKGSGNVPFDPANNRAFLRFKEGSITRGATSVAIRTQ